MQVAPQAFETGLHAAEMLDLFFDQIILHSLAVLLIASPLLPTMRQYYRLQNRQA